MSEEQTNTVVHEPHTVITPEDLTIVLKDHIGGIIASIPEDAPNQDTLEYLKNNIDEIVSTHVSSALEQTPTTLSSQNLIDFGVVIESSNEMISGESGFEETFDVEVDASIANVQDTYIENFPDNEAVSVESKDYSHLPDMSNMDNVQDAIALYKETTGIDLSLATPDNHPEVLEKVVAVQDSLNQAEGTTFLATPVLIGEIPNSYSPQFDVMLINTESAINGLDTLGGTIGHELGHRDNHLKGETVIRTDENFRATIAEECSPLEQDKLDDQIAHGTSIQIDILKNIQTYDDATMLSLGRSGDAARDNLAERGVGENCIEKTVEAVTEYWDDAKNEERSGDAAAVKAGLGAESLEKFEDLEAARQAAGGSQNHEFSSHPTHEERLENIKSNIEAVAEGGEVVDPVKPVDPNDDGGIQPSTQLIGAAASTQVLSHGDAAAAGEVPP